MTCHFRVFLGTAMYVENVKYRANLLTFNPKFLTQPPTLPWECRVPKLVGAAGCILMIRATGCSLNQGSQVHSNGRGSWALSSPSPQTVHISIS